ncbi:MAG: SDR family oxidoreductase [Candidatus Latescibacteria bacterium]|nr:SDR family oxidoreductase [Candidatus Latescibacterota bacterium]
MTTSLADQVALVTGGGSGIGRATAQAFAQRGAQVAVADIDLAKAEETAQAIIDEGGQAIGLQADVRRSDQVEQLVEQIVHHYGRLDCACNNAGLGGGGSTVEATEEAWDLLLDTNLKGVWLCMKYEIAQMLKQGSGAVVNISSIAGLVGTDWGMAPYHASKHGVIGLTRAAALEYSTQGIRVNAVCPGTIRTPMAGEPLDPTQEADYARHHPLGRIGEPAEIAEAVVWLCSQASSFVTGHALPVDGGWTAR